MIRVITFNLNGIRSAAKKGFFTWLANQDADFVCVQELKAQEDQITDPPFKIPGYYNYFHCAQKKGYSGVGIYSKYKPLDVVTGLGWLTADTEGRCIELKFHNTSIISLYMPSGTSGAERQAIKMEFLSKYADHLVDLRKQNRDYIICADMNIAHKAIDLKNWKSNQKNSGFLPEERAWMDELFGEFGFVDAFRELNQDPEHYTFWSRRGQSWLKNVGWRIDYQFLTPSLRDKVKNVSIYKGEQFSDHAPLTIDYDIVIKDG